ncbi:hypothetical protein SAMN06296952_1782 [Oscillospiraceae bacterium]|nr:hypothetical protein SAMN06296952_1782 [Oscillospiraceae bacterium]
MRHMPRTEKILNIIMVIFALIGIVLMVTGKEDGTLQSTGIENFKYYTVLSNVFCGIVAGLYLIRRSDKLIPLKLGAVCGVTITFCVVAFMFGPIYGFLQFYQRGNLFFHLLLPVVAMVEFIIVRRGKIPFRYTILAAIPTLIYGFCYMTNILINGKGEWPDTNDFYGFLNWGWPVGIGIFAVITLSAFGVACAFRAISNKRSLNKKEA